MSFEAYSYWGAGQPAIRGREEMGLLGITVVATFFNILGQISFKQAEINNDRIPVHAYINVVYYAYFEKTGTGN